jgi:hypothetical protein
MALRTTVGAFLLALLAACGSKGHADNGSNCDNAAPSATPPPSPGPGANAAEVTRFADEEPFGPAATTAHDNVSVRKAPGTSDLVTTLPSGTEVTKLAAHGNDALVCFDDPKGGQHLIGWVSAADLQDPPPPGPGEPDGGDEPPPPHKGHHHGKPRRRHH